MGVESVSLISAWFCAGLALAVIMLIAWRVQRLTGNSGWIDVIWSFATGLVGFLLALAPLQSSIAATSPRQLLVAACIGLWSLRLAWHIGARSRGQHEDPRYAQLQRDWGQQFSKRLLVFLQIQAAAAWLLVLAVMLAAHNPAPGLSALDIFGLILAVTGIVGEAIADRQLRRFRATGNLTKSVCDQGLWRWSRHPNYFFEWLTWCSYPLISISFAATAPWAWGWLAWIAPLFMYWLLVHVSGIPPLEAHMLRSRGELYARYQARVSAFFPIPLKSPEPRTPS